MNAIRDAAWEKRQLPEFPTQVTFRGRYQHVDKRLAELLQLDKHRGSTIRVLDVGCGVLSFGSPTLHDMWDAFAVHGVNPIMTGVDVNLPTDLEPTYPSIHYTKWLDQVEGEFDIVRILHVVEHSHEEDYQDLRIQLLRRLRNGGIFVATQKVFYYRPLPKDEWNLLEPTTKIAQKTGNGIRAIELVPEVSLPDWAQGGGFLNGTDFEKYTEHRRDVLEGKEDVPLDLELEGYRMVLERLTWLKTDVLEYETRWRGPGHRGDYLATGTHQLHEYFCDRRRFAQNFWRNHKL